MGIIVYEGPSRLTGKPIVGILTGENRSTRSHNSKIGDLVQLWILDAELSPSQAVKTGADTSVCGDCVHRGVSDGSHSVGRTCYVNVAFAPTAVWHAYKKGSYVPQAASAIEEGLKGRKLRLGAYGDPLAIPRAILDQLVSQADGQVGYTHAWRGRGASRYRKLCMASCESEADARLAQSKGWRTFRVRGPEDKPTLSEIECPASEEKGKVRTCETCMACDGADRPGKRSVTIIAHGGIAVQHNLKKLFRKEAS